MPTAPSARRVRPNPPKSSIDSPVLRRGEIRALTGLRALAAGWVVVHHFWSLTVSDTWVPLLRPLHPFFANGWLGVDLFFVLSGFVLTHTYLPTMGERPRVGTWISFWWNRLSRVWPLWVVVTVGFTGWLVLKHLTVGGDHLHEAVQPSVGVVPLIEQLLMVHVWNQPLPFASAPVSAGWSLSAEWLAYCAFPVLVLCLHRLRRCPAVVLGAGALLAMTPFAVVVAAHGYHDWDWSWVVRIAGGFLAGAFTALCVARMRHDARIARWASFVAAAAMVQVLVVMWWADMVTGDYAGIAVPLFPVVVGALALADRGPARLLGTEWVVTGGRISFALYLVHQAVFEVFWTAMDVVPALGPDSRWQGLVSPVVLVSTVPAAYLLWRFVEEPCRLRMRRMGDARVGAAAGRTARAPESPTRPVREPSARPIAEPRQPATSELIGS